MNKILPIILIVIMTFVAYGVYKQANKSIKTKRIECQSKTTTFEKINIEQPLKEAVNSLKSILSLLMSISSGRQKKESCFSVSFSNTSCFCWSNLDKLTGFPKNMGSLSGSLFN